MRRLAWFSLLGLVACNTAPVGFDQLRGRVPAARDTIMAPDSIASYARYVPLSPADRLFLGSDGYYVARALIRFPLPDTLGLDTVSSVQLVLHPVDSTRMSFVCRPCSTAWDSAFATWLMADDAIHWYSPGGDFWPDSIAGSVLTGDTLKVDLRYAELDSTVRAAIRQQGILLFPRDTGLAAIWSVGASASLKPSIRVNYRSGKNPQTFTATVATTLIDTLPNTIRSGDLLIGPGVALRTWMRFRVDSIPEAATIARAELEFRPDVEYRRSDSLPIAAHGLVQSFADKGAYALYDPLAAASLYYVPASDTDSIIHMDIRGLVQSWTSNRDSTGRDTANYGLLIMAEPEWSEPFRIRVPRTGPGAPRLTIEYVMPPEDRFQ
jgi:hypothetical protein